MKNFSSTSDSEEDIYYWKQYANLADQQIVLLKNRIELYKWAIKVIRTIGSDENCTFCKCKNKAADVILNDDYLNEK